MCIAGHVSGAMLSRHSHVRMEAKRRALDEIAARLRTADEKRRKDADGRAAGRAIAQQPGGGRPTAETTSGMACSERKTGDPYFMAGRGRGNQLRFASSSSHRRLAGIPVPAHHRNRTAVSEVPQVLIYQEA